MVNDTPRPLYPRERAGTHCIGVWVGPRASLDRCRKSRPPPGFDSRTVQTVASRYTDWATLARFSVVKHINSYDPKRRHTYIFCNDMYRADTTFNNRRKYNRHYTPHTMLYLPIHIPFWEWHSHKPDSGLVTIVTKELILCVILQNGLCGCLGNQFKMSVNKTSRWQHTLGYNRGWFVHDMRLDSWLLWLLCFGAVTHKHYDDPSCWAWRVVINNHKQGLLYQSLIKRSFSCGTI